MEENLYDLVFDSGFLDDNDSTSNRRKKNKLNIIKTLKFVLKRCHKDRERTLKAIPFTLPPQK